MGHCNTRQFPGLTTILSLNHERSRPTCGTGVVTHPAVRPGPAPACGAAGPNHAVGPQRLKPRPSSAGPSHRGAPAGSARQGRLRSCVQREEDSSPRSPTRPGPSPVPLHPRPSGGAIQLPCGPGSGVGTAPPGRPETPAPPPLTPPRVPDPFLDPGTLPSYPGPLRLWSLSSPFLPAAPGPSPSIAPDRSEPPPPSAPSQPIPFSPTTAPCPGKPRPRSPRARNRERKCGETAAAAASFPFQDPAPVPALPPPRRQLPPLPPLPLLLPLLGAPLHFRFRGRGRGRIRVPRGPAPAGTPRPRPPPSSTWRRKRPPLAQARAPPRSGLPSTAPSPDSIGEPAQLHAVSDNRPGACGSRGFQGPAPRSSRLLPAAGDEVSGSTEARLRESSPPVRRGFQSVLTPSVQI
ncbi:vegetative cell wall protein gp1-like [Monodon monoceros]|uniref:vegetative cell wall protein gp1-like n=1 Tax=Monodon monoceros TaxID=40151 RepID=UPI0010F4C560|nr:vegetative cell wall protein gp1-like [Monodon monoceros]